MNMIIFIIAYHIIWTDTSLFFPTAVDTPNRSFDLYHYKRRYHRQSKETEQIGDNGRRCMTEGDVD